MSPRPSFPISLPAGDDHPNIDHNSTAADLEALVDHPDPWVRAAAACQFATTAEQRWRFAADPDVGVRFALASTVFRFSGSDIDELCGDDPDPWVRARAVTYCLHRNFTDSLTFVDAQRHERLAARNHRTAASLCNALYADQPCGDTEADRQRHSLFCVARASVALLLRDDCDDRLAKIAVHKVTEAVNHAWIFDGSGNGKGYMPIDERRVLLTPLRERQARPWQHHAKVAELLAEYDRDH